MPAPLVKTLLLSLSLLSALGLAALQNPQVQAWLEEQRRRIAELLRSIGEDLDPEARRAAEAFAFEGKTPATHDGLRREVSGSRDAVAVATGRSGASSGVADSSVALRTTTAHGPGGADAGEERRRKGREYLAKRNQRMHELMQSRKAAGPVGAVSTPPSPTSFDALVDGEGKLKGPAVQETELLPSPPAIEPVPEELQKRMREVERQFVQPLLAGDSSSGSSAFQLGVRLADPFSDDFDIERSPTTRPPVPPKVALEREGPVATHPAVPLSSPPSVLPTESAHEELPYEQHPESAHEELSSEERPESTHEELSYEEQLAIALSLSEADEVASANAATVRQYLPQTEDADLRAAIEASVRDMDGQQAAHAVAHAESLTPRPDTGNMRPASVHPLVDFAPLFGVINPPQDLEERGQSESESRFHHRSLSPPNEEPMTQARLSSPAEPEDELYRITPQLTYARLASLDAQQQQQQQTISPPPSAPADANAAFYSAPSSATGPPPPLPPISPEQPQPPNPLAAPLALPIQHPASLPTDSSSSSFASLPSHSPAPRPHAPSAASEESSAEVDSFAVDVLDAASETDILSDSDEGGEGVLTPDSWTEVGSRDGDASEGSSRDDASRATRGVREL
ncbi:hypothetical protein LTR08_000160 [Meristemomyces frigidus]|nr:hypothetical protein LTR08_000160 [Meristemomyces frigidus]